MEEPIVFIPGNYTREMLDIMSNAGIMPRWRHIKERSNPRVWCIDGMSFLNAIYEVNDDWMSTAKFNNYYLRVRIEGAQNILELAMSPEMADEYPAEALQTFAYAVEAARINSLRPDITKHDVIDGVINIRNAIATFADSRIVLPLPELLEKAREMAAGATVGLSVGELPPALFEEFNKRIENAAAPEPDEFAKLYLLAMIREFNEGIIQLRVNDFRLSGQFGRTRMADGVITVPVQYIADVSRVIPDIRLQPHVTISPSSGVPQNFNTPVTYTISTLDGTQSAEWTVVIEREPVITSTAAEPLTLNHAIYDQNGWVDIGTLFRTYSNSLFGDVDLSFGLSVDSIDGDWPSITFRNRRFDIGVTEGNTEGYIIVLRRGAMEFFRFNNGERTTFFGNIPGMESVFGPPLAAPSFRFGEVNDILLSVRNEGNGVRIIFSANGTEIFNILDNGPGAVTNPGYFGTVNPRAEVKLFNVD